MSVLTTMPVAAPRDMVSSRIPVFAKRLGSWWISLERQPFEARELSCHYDRAARGWAAKLSRLGVVEAYRGLLSSLVEQREIVAEGAVLQALDCGIGTGGLSAALTEAAPGPVALEGVDLSEDMLREASRTLQDSNAVVRLRRGDVRDLPYADDSFDVVMAAHVLEHLADPTEALAEMVRVLRPGGLLLVCLTRRTVSGRWIQVLWRTHRVSQQEAEDWLLKVGLVAPTGCASGVRGAYKKLGLAVWAHKPERKELPDGNHHA